MPYNPSKIKPVHLSSSDILRLFLDCMRDHNTGFHPSREFLLQSNMQKHWNAFEYLHKRFFQKAALETGHMASKIALSSAVAAGTVATTAGPVGAAAAVTGSLVSGVAYYSIRTVTSNAITKGKRGYKLYALRKAIAFASENLSLEEKVLFESKLNSFFHYYWPGYSHARLNMELWAPPFLGLHDQESRTKFDRLKNHLYFKPPKSGERLNQFKITFAYLFLSNIPRIKNDFTRFWETASQWPMLDYLFFNYVFWKEYSEWKNLNTPQLPKFLGFNTEPYDCKRFRRFVYASRSFLLARDFHMEHFFSKILPKYEIHLGKDGGPILGSNILESFFVTIRQKINTHPELQRNPIQKELSKNNICHDILKCTEPFYDFLSPDLQVDFKRFLRSFFLQREDDIFDENSDQVNQKHKDTAYALLENEKEYDAYVENLEISDDERECQLRKVLQERRNLITGQVLYADSLHTDQVSKRSPKKLSKYITKETETFGNFTDPFTWFLVRMQINSRFSKAIEPLQKGSSQIGLTKNAFEGVTAASTVCVITNIQAASSVIAEKKLPKKFRHSMQTIFRLYGAVRHLGGTANLISKTHSGTKIVERILTNYISDKLWLDFSVSALSGPQLISLFAEFAIDYTKKYLSLKIDRDCIVAVEKLIEPYSGSKTTLRRSPDRDITPSREASLVSFRAEGMGASSSSSSSAADFGSSASFRSDGSLKKFETLSDYVQGASIYATSLNQFEKSKIRIPGEQHFIRNDSTTPVYEFLSPARVIVSTPQPIPAHNAGSFVSIPINFYGVEILEGMHLVKYAANLSKLFGEIVSKIERYPYEHSASISIESSAARILYPSDHFQKFSQESKNLSKNHISRMAFNNHPSDIQNVEQAYALSQAWYRATECAFYLLNFENTLNDTVSSKNHTENFELFKKVIIAFGRFIEAITEDKNALENFYTQCGFSETYSDKINLFYIPNFLRAQMCYVRGLYLAGVQLFADWYRKFTKKYNPNETLQFSAHVYSTFPAPSGISFLIQISKNIDFFNLQKTVVGYDFYEKDYNWCVRLPELHLKMEACFREKGYLENETSTLPPFRDFSELSLGFRFKKDPKSFSESENTLLYQDFGRVVRHLFASAPSPQDISNANDEIMSMLQEIEQSTFVSKNQIARFLKQYFEYTKIIVQAGYFINTARMYQFAQEALRLQFLEETLNYRTSIIQALGRDLPHMQDRISENERLDYESIKLLMQQLNDEYGHLASMGDSHERHSV